MRHILTQYRSSVNHFSVLELVNWYCKISDYERLPELSLESWPITVLSSEPIKLPNSESMDIFGPQNKQGKSNWRNDLSRKRRQKVSKSSDVLWRYQLGSDPIFSMSKIAWQVVSRTHFWTSELLNTHNEGQKKVLNTLQARGWIKATH